MASPYFLIGTDVIYLYGFIPLLFSGILFAILLTWLYNNTGGSILVALIFHAMFILSTHMFPALATQQGGLFFLILFTATAVAVLAIWGPRRMVRKEGKGASLLAHGNTECNVHAKNRGISI